MRLVILGHPCDRVRKVTFLVWFLPICHLTSPASIFQKPKKRRKISMKKIPTSIQFLTGLTAIP